MDIKLPSLGEGADSGTVVNVFVKEGDEIKKDQPILELENEKAVATIPATAAGTVKKLHVKPGDKINVGQRIVSLSGGDSTQETETEEPPKAEPAPKASGKPRKAAERPRQEEPETEEDGEEEPEETPSQAEPAAAPSLRRLARELGIDLSRVRGSERGGRIVMGDLKNYIQRLQRQARPNRDKTPAAPEPAAKPAAESIDFSKWGPVTKKPLSPLRQVISRRMAENWNAVPHVTQFDEADITPLLELRKRHAAAYEKKGTKLTLTPLVIKAVASTLKKHGIFNSSLDEAANEIVFKEYVHIGIAVDTEAGLIVPVIRNADQKSILDLSKELEDLAKKARDRKVAAEELKGGTFTISNQGGIGGAHFTPIVNRPEVAILGLGRGALKPVVQEKQIVQRTLLPLALSYDHRVIDGGSAARFVVDLIGALESFPEESVAIASGS